MILLCRFKPYSFHAKSNDEKNTAIWWLAVLASVAAFVGFLMFATPWFWVTLPFVCTSLVKAFDAM